VTRRRTWTLLFAASAALGCSPSRPATGWVEVLAQGDHGGGAPNDFSLAMAMALFIRPSSPPPPSPTLGCVRPKDAVRVLRLITGEPLLDAGNVDVLRAGRPAWTLTREMAGVYDASQPSATFALVPDEPVRVRASGADVPAFVVDLRAPPAVEWLEPACSRPGCSLPSGRADVIVRWAPVAHGFVEVWVFRNGLGWSCTFDARGGGGIIPSGMLPPEGDIEIELAPEEFASLEIGDARINVEVQGPVQTRTFSP
jgi:hypothetical protein